MSESAYFLEEYPHAVELAEEELPDIQIAWPSLGNLHVIVPVRVRGLSG